MKHKIIVTGGAGFIASHVVDAYVHAGHRVSVIDNLLTGSRKNLNPKAKFYKADILNFSLMERIFKKERPEVVNHHAAVVEVAKSLRDPLPTLRTNSMGTANLLSIFGRYGKGASRKFIFASTGGAMYGDPGYIPADDTAPAHPLSTYGLSKLLAEEAVDFYSKFHGFNYCIFRYANVYGPRQNPKGEAGVVAIFSSLMRSGIRPTIFGDGTKTRDYVHVNDVVRANSIALRKGNCVIMNIGTGKEVEDNTIFQIVAKAIGFTKKPRYAPFRKGELLRSALQANRAKRILGWKPTVKLTDGVEKTVAVT